MNRPLIITIGIVIIGLVVSVWVYLLLYGTPKEPREVFTNFGFLTPIPNVPQEEIDPMEQQNVTDLALIGGLELIGTKPVAGHAFLLTPSAIILRYAEMGTGHIYEMNLTDATESQVSITTIQETAYAQFSPDGSKVLLGSFEGTDERYTIGTIDTESKELINRASLPANIQNVAFRDDRSVYYTSEDGSYTIGSYYDLTTNTSVEVFEVPLREITVDWGAQAHTLITRPTPQLPGAMYSIRNGVLSPIGMEGEGLTGFVHEDLAVATMLEEGMYASYAFTGGERLQQSATLIPEKCTFDQIGIAEIWCGIPNEIINGEYLDGWYKGTRTSVDSLWFIDLKTQSARRVVPIKDVVNRDVDVIDMHADITGTYLAFINKIDRSLWLYTLK